MKPIHPIKAGITVAVLLGGWHLTWAILVAFGWAQPLVDFLFWIHFIRPIYAVAPFQPGIAAMLVVVTSAAGFVVAWLFSFLWNSMHLS